MGRKNNGLQNMSVVSKYDAMRTVGIARDALRSRIKSERIFHRLSAAGLRPGFVLHESMRVMRVMRVL